MRVEKKVNCYCAMINKSLLDYERATYQSSLIPLSCICLLCLLTYMRSPGVVLSGKATWEIRWDMVRDRRRGYLVNGGWADEMEEDVLK